MKINRVANCFKTSRQIVEKKMKVVVNTNSVNYLRIILFVHVK